VYRHTYMRIYLLWVYAFIDYYWTVGKVLFSCITRQPSVVPNWNLPNMPSDGTFICFHVYNLFVIHLYTTIKCLHMYKCHYAEDCRWLRIPPELHWLWLLWTWTVLLEKKSYIIEHLALFWTPAYYEQTGIHLWYYLSTSNWNLCIRFYRSQPTI